MDRVKELEQKIGYVFKDKSLIERALIPIPILHLQETPGVHYTHISSNASRLYRNCASMHVRSGFCL